jgi:hypothetical protein
MVVISCFGKSAERSSRNIDVVVICRTRFATQCHSVNYKKISAGRGLHPRPYRFRAENYKKIRAGRGLQPRP